MYRRKVELILINAIRKAFPDRDTEGFFPITLDVCNDDKLGDYSSTIAIIIANDWGMEPPDVSSAIVGAVDSLPQFCRFIKASPNGFINVALEKESIYYALGAIIKKDEKFAPYSFGFGKKAEVLMTTSSIGQLSADDGRVIAVSAVMKRVLSLAGYRASIGLCEMCSGESLWLSAAAAEHRYRELLGDSHAGHSYGFRGRYSVGIAKEVIRLCGADYMYADRPGRISVIKDMLPSFLLSGIKAACSSMGVNMKKHSSTSSFEGIRGLYSEITAAFRDKGLLYEEEAVPVNYWICGHKEDFRTLKGGESKRAVRAAFDSFTRAYRFWQPADIRRAGGPDGSVDDLEAVTDMERSVYPISSQIWLRSSSFGDVCDRLFMLPGGEPSEYLADLALIISKLKGGADEVFLVRPSDEAFGIYSKYACALSFLGYEEGRLKTIGVEKVSLKNFPRKNDMQKGESASLADVSAAIADDGYMAENMKKGPQLPLTIDCMDKNTAMREINEALLRMDTVIKEASRLGYMPELKTIASKDLSVLSEDSEIRLIKHAIIYPSLICDVAENFNIGSLYDYMKKLIGCFNSWYDSEKMFSGGREYVSARAVLAAAVRSITVRLRPLFVGGKSRIRRS